jgi:hypothetical protein
VAKSKSTGTGGASGKYLCEAVVLLFFFFFHFFFLTTVGKSKSTSTTGTTGTGNKFVVFGAGNILSGGGGAVHKPTAVAAKLKRVVTSAGAAAAAATKPKPREKASWERQDTDLGGVQYRKMPRVHPKAAAKKLFKVSLRAQGLAAVDDDDDDDEDDDDEPTVADAKGLYPWRKCGQSVMPNGFFSAIPPFKVSNEGILLKSLWTAVELKNWATVVDDIYAHDKTRQSYQRVCEDMW